MCGIAGFAGFGSDPDRLAPMLGVMRHRGPDDDGALVADGIGLGMRRLSIIDVEGGHQPLFNEDRSLALVLNGEIYNYRELARQLAGRGHRLASRSDAETVLHLFEEEGIDCLRHLRGMFGLAICDLRRRRLFLARDRLGIKPLYYWSHGGRLVFGSEIKALLECPEVPREPFLPAIDAYLRLRYSPGPTTMFAGIRKLPAGHWLAFADGQLRIERWWRPQPPDGPRLSDGEWLERFAATFEETVRLHLESDVPVGAFLSGGLDSSLVVAEATRLGGHGVHTFSVGFGWGGDETPEARATAAALGCEHHEVRCVAQDLSLLERIVWHSDEPLGDPITLPVFLLARAAREHVKVVLTGEGADEILAGYLFHRVLDLTHRAGARLPRGLLRGLAAPLARRLPVGLLDRFFDYPAGLGERGRRKLAAFLELAADDDPAALYESLISLFEHQDLARLYRDGAPAERIGASGPDGRAIPGATFLDRVLAVQYASWLPDNILARQDRMSMAHGVESRVPFLDHVLVELLLAAPPRLKLRPWRGENKILARRYARRRLPPAVAARRKRAFYIPAESYFEAPAFRALLADTLDPQAVRRRGYFAPDAVRDLVAFAESSREFVAVKQVLALVMLELWHRTFVDRRPPREAPA